MKPIMTIQENSEKYMTSVNGLSLTIEKNVVVYCNDTKLHPRMIAIEFLAALANIQDWNLINI